MGIIKLLLVIATPMNHFQSFNKTVTPTLLIERILLDGITE